MSNEELALALTETAIKCGVFRIPSNIEELPYALDGSLEPKNVENCMADIINIYRAALKLISKK